MSAPAHRSAGARQGPHRVTDLLRPSNHHRCAGQASVADDPQVRPVLPGPRHQGLQLAEYHQDMRLFGFELGQRVILRDGAGRELHGRLPADDRRYLSVVPTQLRRWLDTEADALIGFDSVLVGGAAASFFARASRG